jgi:hypothetical protein
METPGKPLLAGPRRSHEKERSRTAFGGLDNTRDGSTHCLRCHDHTVVSHLLVGGEEEKVSRNVSVDGRQDIEPGRFDGALGLDDELDTRSDREATEAVTARNGPRILNPDSCCNVAALQPLFDASRERHREIGWLVPGYIAGLIERNSDRSRQREKE